MLIDTARKTIKKYHLVKKGDKILIGVSGGADSVALLYLFKSLERELDLSLHICHLDHMLRPDSYKDRLFVENLSRRLNVPITSAKISLKALVRKGSVEEIARNVRLDFLFRVAKEIGAKRIALGHNLDDQAETVLMRLLRGTGLYGMSAILPKRNIAGFEIIRPLIEARRRDIVSFLKKRKIKPCLDSSNFEDIYFRNRIRNRLLPLLESKYNRNIKEILSNFAESSKHDYDYLNRAAQTASKRLGKRINLKEFLKLHPAIQRLVLRLNIARVKGDMRSIAFKHIREIEDLIFYRPVNSVVDLPKGVSAIKKTKIISFYHR